MSRDTMRGLKAKVDEEKRLQRINELARSIYWEAVTAAKTKTDTSYKFPIPLDRFFQPKRAAQAAQQGRPLDPFYTENMSDILSALQILFPECTISYSVLCRGTDGKFYGVSTLDEKVLPFVDRALDQSFIVIDWS